VTYVGPSTLCSGCDAEYFDFVPRVCLFCGERLEAPPREPELPHLQLEGPQRTEGRSFLALALGGALVVLLVFAFITADSTASFVAIFAAAALMMLFSRGRRPT